MEKGYLDFFKRASEVYSGPGGHNSLLEAINSGMLRDGLNEEEYGIAKLVLSDFFKEHNTTGSNRIWGIYDFECDKLVKRCRERTNTSLQSA